MADVTSRLRLVVDSTGVDKAGNKLKDLKRAAKEADDTARGLKNAFMGLAGVLGAAFSVRAVIQYADAWKRAENQIKTVTSTIEGVRSAQEGVFAVAQKTFSAYDATANLYTKLTRAGGDLIGGQKEALRLVETVNKALAVGGASAAERNSVILQLGQAVGSGRLQGDEFRSISENAPLILDAIAKSTGKARAELKQLGTEGKITSEVLIKSLKDYGDTVDATFGKFAPTIGDAFTKLENAFQKFVSQNGAPLFSGIAAAISLLADNLDTVAKYAVIAGTAFTTAFISSNLVGWIESATKAVKALGLAIASNPIGLIATAIAAAAVAFYEFSDSMKVAEGQFKSTNAELKGEILSYSVTVQDVLKEIPGFIGDVFHGLSKSTGAYLKTAFGPDVLDNISEFFKTILQIAKKSINVMIGLWVGLPTVIGQTVNAIPLLINEAFTNALNAAGRTIANFVNKNRDIINGMIKAVSIVTHIPMPEIPVVQWNDFVTPATGAAKKVGDAWKGVFNTDYIGSAIDLAIKGMGQLKDRAIATKKAQAEAEALAARSAAGGGVNPTGSSPADAAAKAAKDQEAALLKANIAAGAFKGSLSAISDLMAKTVADALELPIAIARQRTGIQNIIKDMKAYNDQAEKAMSGGGEEYDRFLARKALEQQLGEKITALSAEELKNLEDQYIVEQKRYDLDQRRIALLDTNRAAITYAGLTDAFDGFFDALPRKGLAAFKELATSFTDVFATAFANALRAAFDPFVQKFNKALSDAVTNALGSFSADGKAGKGLLGTIEKGIDGIFGKGSTAKVASWGTNVLGGYAAGSGLVSAFGLNGKTAAQQLNSSVGSAVGAALGSIIPGVGTIIGSIVGGVLGGLLGPKSADNRAAANLTASGSISGSIFGKPTDETSSALTSVIGAISSGYDALKKLGGTLGATITSLHIGNRDQSQATLSNGQTVNAGSVGDAADLANDALLSVLKTTTFATESLNKIKDAMIAAGSSFDDTYSALSSVQAIIKSVTPALSDWKQKLQDIDDIFKPLIASTGQYNAALVQAYNATRTALTAAFDTDINSKLLAARNPGAASYASMLQEQFTRMTDLAAVGGNLTKVLALNEQETRNFVDSLNGDYSSLTDLKTVFGDLMRAASLAGQDITALKDVINKSLTTIADQFNKDIGSQIKGYLTSPTDQLNDLLKSQAARLEQAKAAGADIAQVERLTSLELQRFFKGLSDDALKEVSDFLGLFDQATNSVVQNLDMSRQDLQGMADSFGQYAQNYAQLSADLTQKYIAASPRESIGLLRGNVESLLGKIANGNDAAAQGLPDAINKLVDAARSTYGNTDAFNQILAYAQNALATAGQSALNVQSDAEKQIAALDANNDILSDIRDILQSSQSTNAFFQSYLSGGVASSDALLALIQQGAGLTTTAANDNASALNITGLIAQSVQPIIAPLATSIDNFTQRLATMPSLQQLTIEAVDRGTDNIVSAIDRLDNRMDRIETLNKKQLSELEQLPKAS